MAFTTSNDINVLTASDSTNVGAGAGSDRYVLSSGANFTAGQVINISDTEGTNTLQLIGGLTITSSKVTANAVQLTLSNGATVNLLGADTFTFEIGGDPLTNTPGTIRTFSSFVTNVLGTTVPTGSTVSNGASNIVVASNGTTTNGGVPAPTPTPTPTPTPVPTPTPTPGSTFTLTTGSDTGAAFTGTAADDTFNAGVILSGSGTLIDTLQNVDQLNGGAGNDTLIATLNGLTVVTPTLSLIENVIVRTTSATTGLDLSGSTGVTSVTVSGSNATTTAATVTNVGAAALAVTNQRVGASFDKSTATAMTLTLDTVGVVSASPAVAVQAVIDLGKTAAPKATSLSVTANASNAEVTTSVLGGVVTTLNIAATGANTLKMTDAAGTATAVNVTGAGSVDLTGTSFIAALKTLTAGDGGLKITGTSTTATNLTATTGAGADTLTFNGANVKTISTGAGNDTVTLNTGVLAATASVSLGDGNDTISLSGGAPTPGATVDGGTGTDTISVSTAVYNTISGGTFSTVQRALISGFEVLSISDTLANGSSYDVSKLVGVGSFTAAAGIATGSAAVTNLGAASTVTIAGSNGTGSAGTNETASFTFVNLLAAATEIINGLTVTAGGGGALAADVATAFRTGTTTGGAAVSGTQGATYTTSGAGTNVIYTATAAGNQTNLADTGSAPVTPTVVDGTAVVAATANGTLVISLATDTAADLVNLVLNPNYVENNDATSTPSAQLATVTAQLVETVSVSSSGKASVTFAGAAGTLADTVNNTLVLNDNVLATLNVTGNQVLTYVSTIAQTKLATIDASANTGGLVFTGAAADVTTPTSSLAMNIKGSLTAANTLTGTGYSDTIVGGSKADIITGGKGGDTLTGNGGNDKFVLAAGDSTIASGNADRVTDFISNTFGAGTAGAVTPSGATTVLAAALNGDVLQLANLAVGSAKIVTVGVYTNAADATTFLQTQSASEGVAANQSVHAALNSTTGDLYIDNDGNGTADFYIQLTGVTTLNAAAFVIV